MHCPGIFKETSAITIEHSSKGCSAGKGRTGAHHIGDCLTDNAAAVPLVRSLRRANHHLAIRGRPVGEHHLQHAMDIWHIHQPVMGQCQQAEAPACAEDAGKHISVLLMRNCVAAELAEDWAAQPKVTLPSARTKCTVNSRARRPAKSAILPNIPRIVWKDRGSVMLTGIKSPGRGTHQGHRAVGEVLGRQVAVQVAASSDGQRRERQSRAPRAQRVTISHRARPIVLRALHQATS